MHTTIHQFLDVWSLCLTFVCRSLLSTQLLACLQSDKVEVVDSAISIICYYQ